MTQGVTTGLMRKYTRIFFILLLLALAPALAAAIEVGKPAPGFKLKAVDGQTVSLADYRGQVVLLKLATTWCPTCAQLTRELAAIGDFLKEHEVVLLEVFIQDTEEMVARYLAGKEYPMVHRVMLDDRQVYKAYGIYLIPRFLILDREHKVRYDNGATAAIPPAEELKQLVEAALKN
jgi:peroxiredoxin